MSRSPKRSKKSEKNEPGRIGLVLPSSIIQQIDAAAEKLEKAVPGSSVTRSEVVRRAIHQFLNG